MHRLNFHTAILKAFGLFRKVDAQKTVSKGIVIFGGALNSDPDGANAEQAYRFSKEHFTEAQARKWLTDNKVEFDTFEPAIEENSQKGVSYRTIGGELRVDGEGEDGKKIVGHAAVFNQLSLPMYGFREQVLPGAFKKTIKESDIRALWNHNPNNVLGRNTAGTLELSEDDTGLAVRITPPDTQWAKDLSESIRRGDVSQMSFGFRTIKDSFHTEEGMITRNLEEVQLFDVSPVTYPAYPTTDVSVRALAFAASQAGETRDSKLFKAMLKLNAGEELRDDELVALKDFASTLQKKLTPSAPTEGHAGNTKPAGESRHLSINRLKLDLIKITEETT